MGALLDARLGEEVRALGSLASAAMHGPAQPDPDDADAAWAHLRAAERIITGRRGRRIVLLRYLDPRVLRHRAPLAPGERTPHRDTAAADLLAEYATSGDGDVADRGVDL
jgi:hypothetical protein